MMIPRSGYSFGKKVAQTEKLCGFLAFIVNRYLNCKYELDRLSNKIIQSEIKNYILRKKYTYSKSTCLQKIWCLY